MTIVQRLLTLGQPFYWAMVVIPNLAVLLLSVARSRQRRAFILIVIAALFNMIVPYAQKIIFGRCNGIEAPGTPQWVVWAVGTMALHQGTVVLLLALASIMLLLRNAAKNAEK